MENKKKLPEVITPTMCFMLCSKMHTAYIYNLIKGKGVLKMENKKKLQYSPVEIEKRDGLMCFIREELCAENLTSYTTEFLSDLVEFIENYGFDD